MSIQGLSLSFCLLFISFLRESICICDRTTWTKVGWEIFPEEVHCLKLKPSPSHCLPYPLDKLCCNFANVNILQTSFHFIYILVQALFLILSVLSVHYLWMKWKKHQKQLKKSPSPETVSKILENHCMYDIDQILCQLATTTSIMNKYLNQVTCQPAAKKVKHRKLKRKKKEGGGARGY